MCDSLQFILILKNIELVLMQRAFHNEKLFAFQDIVSGNGT